MIFKLPNENGGYTRYYKSIRQEDTVSDILDEIYFSMSDIVEPYMYLKKWVLREIQCGRLLIMSDITDWVSALSIFKRNTEWEVILIEQPMADSIYNRTDSDRIKFRLLDKE